MLFESTVSWSCGVAGSSFKVSQSERLRERVGGRKRTRQRGEFEILFAAQRQFCSLWQANQRQRAGNEDQLVGRGGATAWHADVDALALPSKTNCWVITCGAA